MGFVVVNIIGLIMFILAIVTFALADSLTGVAMGCAISVVWLLFTIVANVHIFRGKRSTEKLKDSARGHLFDAQIERLSRQYESIMSREEYFQENVEEGSGVRNLYEDIKKQAENLTAMTNSLVSLARMDERNGHIKRVVFPVSDLAEEAVRSYNALALDSGKHFTYDITPDLTCYGDASSVRQLFTILLDNAFKYSSGKGNIDFKLSSSGSYIVLIVSNDVDNIDKNLTDRMFDRFYRADSTSAKITGYGLGLSIAKAIVSEHNGSIKAKMDGSQRIIIKAQLHIK